IMREGARVTVAHRCSPYFERLVQALCQITRAHARSSAPLRTRYWGGANFLCRALRTCLRKWRSEVSILAEPQDPPSSRSTSDSSAAYRRLELARAKIGAGGRALAAQARGTPGEVLAAFTRLGLTSFGGPVAHLGYFRAEFVVRR